MPSRRATIEAPSEPLSRRVAVGFRKLAQAMKHREWSLANDDGLSPTQGQILATLALEGALTGSELSRSLGITLPTLSDAVRVLVEKGAVTKQPDPRHPRAVRVSLTERGRALAGKVATWPDFLAVAVGDLSEPEQEALLTGVVKMIRSLQLRGLIPASRMCASCRYFRPNVHDGPKPHHCAFADAPIAARELRLECGDHEAVEPTDAEELWRAFLHHGGPSPAEGKRRR